MKIYQKVLLVCALLNGMWLMSSCTNEEQPEAEVSAAKLAEFKQKIRAYAHEYGVDDFQFDDELLAPHVNMSDEEIEREVIHWVCQAFPQQAKTRKMAMARKRFASSSMENPEFKTFTGTFYATGSRDSFNLRAAIDYSYCLMGTKSISAGNSSTYTKNYKCSDKNCTITHQTGNRDANCTAFKNGAISGILDGEHVSLTFPFRGSISAYGTEDCFSYSFEGEYDYDSYHESSGTDMRNIK